MFIQAFIQMLPILLIALLGYLTHNIFKLDEKTMIHIVSDIFMPLLIFFSLYTSDIQGALVVDMIKSITVFVSIMIGISYLYAKIAKIDPRETVPSTVFMNSGFLGIPLMKLWGGIAAMNVVVIFDQIQSFYMLTIGLMIITGGFSVKSLLNVVKAPVVWAIILGACFTYFKIPVWDPLLQAMEFGGNIGPPLAAYLLGAMLQSHKVYLDIHLFVSVLLRMVGGFLVGLFCTYLFNITGMPKVVFVVTASFPPAVFTAVLPVRYGVPSRYASSIVVVSTLISIITIPFAFMLLS
ncbi:MAG: AEC family transporter [Sphaerochaetaceae bacterium]